MPVPIKALQTDLDKLNGVSAENLKDDLCITNPLADDPELLQSILESAADGIISATQGQFFIKNSDNEEYCIKVEGGINIDVIIKEYETRMSEDARDEAYYDFLQKTFPLDDNTYRQGFKIWQHTTDWQSHKAFREGYIFFGNPNEKSTTHPIRHFYMIFMPIFDKAKQIFNNESDEVYFIQDELSDEFKMNVCCYGAAKSLEASASSDQKRLYRQKIDEFLRKARTIFNQEYAGKTTVSHKGTKTKLNAYQLPGQGATLEQIFSEVTSTILDDNFTEQCPDYPLFTNLIQPLSKDNFDRQIKQAIKKIINPQQPNKDGEGILHGLGLWSPGKVEIQNSKYAAGIMQKIKSKNGKVVNRDEILECFYTRANLWQSKDYKIEADLEFLALSALVYLGEIEIVLSSGNTITPNSIKQIETLSKDDFYTFTHIKPPKDINIALIKAVFDGLGLPDLSAYLDKDDTYITLRDKAREISEKAVTLNHKIQDGLKCRSIDILNIGDINKYREELTKISEFCDKISNYNSKAKLKNFNDSKEDIAGVFQNISYISELEELLKLSSTFEEYISYLNQSLQYVCDQGLKADIDKAIDMLAINIKNKDQKKIKTYESELKSLKDRYASHYIEQYTKYLLPIRDFAMKEKIMQSDKKKICDSLKDADFLSTAKYKNWLDNILKLRQAENITKQQVLGTPYHNFNPMEFIGKPKQSINELKQELEDIFDLIQTAMRETFDDPGVQKSLNLISDNEADILRKFSNCDINLEENNVVQIRDLISKISKGLEKLEIDDSSLRSVFNRPMTPEESVEKFKAYIDKITAGKDRNKLRIIIFK